jgi:hypothetical protein
MFPIVQILPCQPGGEEKMKGMRLRRFAHNLRRESDFFIFSLVTHWKVPIRTNKTKEIQGLLLGFIWFCLEGIRALVESGRSGSGAGA